LASRAGNAISNTFNNAKTNVNNALSNAKTVGNNVLTNARTKTANAVQNTGFAAGRLAGRTIQSSPTLTRAYNAVRGNFGKIDGRDLGSSSAARLVVPLAIR